MAKSSFNSLFPTRKTNSKTRLVAVYLETHCNIGSINIVYHRRTLQVTQLFTYLLTHKLLSSCIRQYLVSRACDRVMSALSAVLLTFSFQLSLLFFNISLTRPHQSHIHGSGPHHHCCVLLDNIRRQTLSKIWVSPFLVRSVHPRGKTLN